MRGINDWGLVLLPLAGLLIGFSIPLPSGKEIVVPRRCPEYDGQRIVSSRTTLATGEVLCVYAPRLPPVH